MIDDDCSRVSPPRLLVQVFVFRGVAGCGQCLLSDCKGCCCCCCNCGKQPLPLCILEKAPVLYSTFVFGSRIISLTTDTSERVPIVSVLTNWIAYYYWVN